MAELRHFSKDQAAKLRALMDTAVRVVEEGCQIMCVCVCVCPVHAMLLVLRVWTSHVNNSPICRATLQT